MQGGNTRPPAGRRARGRAEGRTFRSPGYCPLTAIRLGLQCATPSPVSHSASGAASPSAQRSRRCCAPTSARTRRVSGWLDALRPLEQRIEKRLREHAPIVTEYRDLVKVAERLVIRRTARPAADLDGTRLAVELKYGLEELGVADRS